MRVNRKLADMMRRASQGLKAMIRCPPLAGADQVRHNADARRWTQACAKYMLAGLPGDEIRRRVSVELGLSLDYSPGRT